MNTLTSVSGDDISGMTKVFVSMADYNRLDAIVDWCNERFDWDDEWLWEYDNGEAQNYDAIFYFTKPKHATLFALIWL